MSPPKHTKFCDSWLVDDEFQCWLARDKKSDRSAECKLCMCTIELRDMQGCGVGRFFFKFRLHLINCSSSENQLRLPTFLKPTPTPAFLKTRL